MKNKMKLVFETILLILLGVVVASAILVPMGVLFLVLGPKGLVNLGMIAFILLWLYLLGLFGKLVWEFWNETGP